MESFDRRRFLKSATGLLSLAALDLMNPSADAQEAEPAQAPAPRGANERINVALIGCGDRGRGSHINPYNARSNCKIVYVCDPDTSRSAGAASTIRNAQGEAPVAVQDMRRIMEDRNVDVVSIATCNHWHSLAAIWAMQAGKDVYVEKPLSHNVFEGQRVVEIARQTNRVCQVGTQMRSNPALVEAMAFLAEGRLGRIEISRGLCYKARSSIGQVDGPQPIPANLDYNLWCGPAPTAPSLRNTQRGTIHYDWHWFWNYGNGDLGNQGIHEMDIARWGIGVNEFPRSVQTIGGRLGYVDSAETPNTLVSYLDFGDKKIVYEVRGLRTQAYQGASVGNVFHCENGYLVTPSYTSAVAYDKDGGVIRRFSGGNDGLHFANFLQVVRSRRMADLHGECKEGHLSAALVHLANISYRVGTQAALSELNNVFGDNSPANEAATRMVQHLRDNRVDVAAGHYTLGRRLTINPQDETIVNDAEATWYMRREYRAPFCVPERA